MKEVNLYIETSSTAFQKKERNSGYVLEYIKGNAFLFGADEPINNPVVGPTGGGSGNQTTAAIRAAMGLPEEK